MVDESESNTLIPD